ncbi:lytic transglycosylase domain-containing protein [Carboxylicivirga sp. M1479]|uniref:lytic transglycosylase domain-containing protein n=1 Tax=Carboxylicivirga sp. M1479 TaxID=2594476 RepID=UPI0011789F0D|nr:lytic transglycosylase domain-containing protein [Carboxylicivirga sp. M1479]TRX72206.1 LysM peptidoglycan-binding domain-containing protein [Carboxylicivirga sp. M1479]
MQKVKELALLACMMVLGLIVNAQSDVDSIPQIDTPPYLEECLDSLVNQWYISMESDEVNFRSDRTKPVGKLPDSVYIKRIEAISSPMPYTYNSIVRGHIELYTIRRRELVQRMLGLSEYYFPMIEHELDARQMPLELKYLPIIESALNPKAYSRAGASGLWQFMYYTGKQYGLNINSYVDERRDPYKSTVAAIDFLDDLYAIYKDWFLVIAAYNCGPGNVNKAIRRSGGHRDFWKIYYHLPRETRGYVPAFIAATYAFMYAHEHDIVAVPHSLPVVTDTIAIHQPLHFKQVAAMLDVNVDYLRSLNPQYRKDLIPSGNDFALRLAINDASDFAAIEDSIYAYKRDTYFVHGKSTVKPEYTTYTPDTPKNKATVYYTVKSGDAIGLIADWYDVRTSDLRYWNNVSRNMIRVGQKLRVYVPRDKTEYYGRINDLSYSEKQKLSSKSVTSNSSKPKKNEPIEAGYDYYTVRSGDNLWTIAKKYTGISNKDIMQLNGLSESSKLWVGQRLKIRPKS